VELRGDRIAKKVCLLCRYRVEEDGQSPPGCYSYSYSCSYFDVNTGRGSVAGMTKLKRGADFAQIDAASRMGGQFEFGEV